MCCFFSISLRSAKHQIFLCICLLIFLPVLLLFFFFPMPFLDLCWHPLKYSLEAQLLSHFFSACVYVLKLHGCNYFEAIKCGPHGDWEFVCMYSSLLTSNVRMSLRTRT